jgi:plastocyanin
MNISHRIALTILLIATVISFENCEKSDGPKPAPQTSNPPAAMNEVSMKNSMFTPETLVVSLNTTVKWINDDKIAHNVMSNTAIFSSGNMVVGATFTYKFTSAGTFPYKCTLHPGMDGVIIVNAQ